MDYNEILCQAIDTIVAKRISEISFDKTILCTISDDSKKENGEYTVTDGAVSFQAFSDNDKYQKGYQVYVQIPMGNYANKKLIVGRYRGSEESKPVSYASPMDKMVIMTKNYAAGQMQGAQGLIANRTKQEGEKAEDFINLFSLNEIENTINYDTICIKADFKTLLQNYAITSGNYGLRVVLETANQTINLELDCTKDMFGNPYAYTSYFSHNQTYRLNLSENIDSIQAYFYQRGNFKYNTGEDVEPQPVPDQGYPNIFINNIEIFFGYDANINPNQSVKINTTNSMYYNVAEQKNLDKTLFLMWYNKDSNNNYIGFLDGSFSNTVPNKDDIENNKYFIQWQFHSSDGAWLPLEQEQENGEYDYNNKTIVNLEVNQTLTINEYRAVIYFRGNQYISNVLSFQNRNGAENEVLNTLNLLLTLHNGDHSFDSYAAYNADTTLINPADGYIQRSLYFSYDGNKVNEEFEASALNGATAYFYIPKDNTMLEGPGGGINPIEEDPNAIWYLEGYDAYSITLPTTGNISQENKTFKYRIKQHFNPLFTNNRIILKVVDKSGYTYITSKSFSFSRTGSSGSDYLIIIDQVDGNDISPTDNSIKIAAKLFNSNFKEQSVNKWNWMLYHNQKVLSADENNILTVTPAIEEYQVIEASTTIKQLNQEVTVRGLYPIFYAGSSNYYYQGPTSIVYNNNGVNPAYYEGDINLFDKESHLPNDNCTWHIEYYTSSGLSKNLSPEEENRQKSYGQLITTQVSDGGEISYKFKPSSLFLGTDVYMVLVATNGEEILWRQPLIILQNSYATSSLQTWAGSIIVDDGIISPTIGSGVKNDQNKFSGVVMGDVELDVVGEDRKQIDFGLFGYQDGAQSFGFKSDGTAIIGAAGKGRIEFNADTSIIKSPEEAGMEIDVDKGSILTKILQLKSSEKNNSLILNSAPESDDEPALRVGGIASLLEYTKNNGLIIDFKKSDDNKFGWNLSRNGYSMSVDDNILLTCNSNGFNINQAKISDSELINCISNADIADTRYNTSIEDIDSRYEVFYNNINPVRYKYGNEASQRYHIGFTAQQVAEALTEGELATEDFAGIVLKKQNTEQECWYLNRDEFIALNVWQIQKLKEQIADLETQVQLLREQLNPQET